jgi:metal-responsive CopG/Arc/MetJ family transcriptional regulator
MWRQKMARTASSAAGDKLIRKNITLPESYVQRLEKIRLARGNQSDSETIRQMITFMELLISTKAELLTRGEHGELTKIVAL